MTHQNLERAVALWSTWCKTHGVDPHNPTHADTQRFYRGCLCEQTLTVRLAYANALSEWCRREGRPDPFGKNPLPYNLLVKFVSPPWSEVWSRICTLYLPDRGGVALVALTRVDVETASAWLSAPKWSGDAVQIDGRVVPVTHEVRRWIVSAGYLSPGLIRAKLQSIGLTVKQCHTALMADLIERGVPETTRATLYGRWSAMGLVVARQPVGLFRVPMP